MLFHLFFLIVIDKDGKTWSNAQKDDFNQQTVLKAPTYWSKYATKELCKEIKKLPLLNI